MDNIEPALPMDRIEPALPMLRIENALSKLKALQTLAVLAVLFQPGTSSMFRRARPTIAKIEISNRALSRHQ
jgi:hypothetical protein